LGVVGPLSTQGPNNNTKIQIIEMKSRKKSTNPNIIMNIIKIRGKKEYHRNDKKMKRETKTNKIEKNNVIPNLS